MRIAGWNMVDGYRNLPVGKWLVVLEKELQGSRVHAAVVHKNMATIATVFAFDAPKVIGYRELPPVPELRILAR